MDRRTGREIVYGLKKQWTQWALFTNGLLALAIATPAYALCFRLFSAAIIWGVVLWLLLFALTSFVNRKWRLNEWEVSRILNAAVPTLEESSHLSLLPVESLSMLENLQVRKVEAALQNMRVSYPFQKSQRTTYLFLLAGILLAALILTLPGKASKQVSETTTLVNVNTIHEVVLPTIKKAALIISPPPYTGRAARQQERFNLQAEEGAIVTWHLQTTVAAKNVMLLFNDGSSLKLSADKASLNWRTQKGIKTSGFYQVKIDNQLSELYRIEAIKDQKPVITVQSPKPSTTIAYGQPERVLLSVAINDDYGITEAGISATISSGQGEAVKFKEQRLSFAGFAAGGRAYRLQKTIDCKALGMQPGDELYFFVSTKDNRQQESRSDVYIVTLEDTTGLFTMEGLATGLDIKPELFRSQRQIIIETEQLLKDRATIGDEAFKKKSNDLGTDQKLLRLRYGKFLGEETDVEIGGHDEHGEKGGAAEEPADIMDQYSHKHDNAEDATFFDAATKKQLKETLNEMWKAELQLRTMKPAAALPFEYKALRLLKDLQQKSRVYVAKTGVKTTPLKEDKRLSGDLSEIIQPVAQRSLPKKDRSETTRAALGILEQLKEKGRLSASSQAILQTAFQQLSMQAANNPAVYLSSLSALKKILADDFRLKDIKRAQAGLQKLTASPIRFPYAAEAGRQGLEKAYFSNLNRGGRQ
jgi:hypothetical protein